MCKPLTILLHGFMGTASSHFNLLIRHWYKILPLRGIDLPGHGKISPDAQYFFYDQCLAYLADRTQHYEQFNIIGLSYLGGTLALRFAALYPQRVKTLIISGFTYAVPMAAFIAWSEGFNRLVKENPVLAAEYDRLHGKRWIQTISTLIEDANVHYKNSIFIDEDMLYSLKVPTLLMNGNYKKNEIKAANTFNQTKPYFHGCVIPDAGHIVPQTHASLFCQYAENFWRKYDVINS